ncbi:MAG: ABC transporter permease subunit [Bdellovibrionia bacterium]
MQIPRWLGWIATTWIFLFWILCVGIPLSMVLLQLESGSATLSIWDPSVLHVARATFLQALYSTAISAVLGTAIGVWIRTPVNRAGGFTQGGLVGWTHSLLAIPYSIPTVVAAQAWILWLGRSGVLAKFGIHLDWMYSLKSVILAHVFFNVPFVALMVSQAKLEVPKAQIEAAQLMGANGWSRFRWIIWPYIRWSAASSWAQVMALCGMSFGLVLILGGGPPVQTLEVEIYQRLRTGSMDLPGAVICGFWELLITLTPWALVLFFNSKQHHFLKGLPVSAFRGSDCQSTRLRDVGFQGARFQGVSLFGFIRSFRFWGLLESGLVAFFIIPYGIILNRETFANFLDPLWQRQVSEPLMFSLLLAFLTSVLTLITAGMAVLSLRYLQRWTKAQAIGTFLMGIPSGVSILVLGLGVWMAYGRWVDPFDGSLLAIVALQVTIAFPVALRLLLPLLKGVQVRELEAALLLGANPFRAFWDVEWARWRGLVFRVLALSAAASLGELGAVSLFYSEKLIPLPLLISRLMQQYRFDEAQGVSGLLFLLCLLILAGPAFGKFRLSHAFKTT